MVAAGSERHLGDDLVLIAAIGVDSERDKHRWRW
ncbi:hypothetical protein ACVIHH_008347 [Bradyrhizobium sp. USDA 4518]